MKFFIDFEATQPEQEIISIGAYSEDTFAFHNLVKPQFSVVSSYIADMTGITNEILEDKFDLDTVLCGLYDWCYRQQPSLTKWEFYSYGDSDVDFLKHSMCNIHSERALIVASIMIATMKDYSQQVKKFFGGSTSLIKAFNFLKDLENKQHHNALEDAKMLADVYQKVENGTPLKEYPFHIGSNTNEAYTFPSGTFYCGGTGKNAKEREFVNIQDAITWLINTNIAKNERERVHRDRVAKNIMKAIRKKSTYMGYKWRRIK